MKAINSKTGLIFLILLLFCILSANPILAQPVLKEPRKTKDFGKSLEQYGKKGEKGKKTKDAGEEDTITVETNLIANDVLVINQKGNAIAGLKKEDFIVTENGESQEIGIFSFGEDAKVPRSIVLILENGGIPSLVDQSIDAAKKLVDNLNSTDRMAIASDNLKLLCDFTKDKKLLKSALDSLKKHQGASRREFSTLLAVLNEMFDDEDIRPIVILQSSGDEYLFLKPIWKGQDKICSRGFTDWCERNFSFIELKKAVEKSRATVYGIIPIPPVLYLPKSTQIEKTRIYLEKMSREIHQRTNKTKINDFVNDEMEITLKEIIAMQTSVLEVSNLSGGYVDFIEKPEDAETVYNTIFQTIANRYVIGYYPKNETKDGKRRNVKIEVKNHPEYIVVGRKSYIAPMEEK